MAPAACRMSRFYDHSTAAVEHATPKMEKTTALGINLAAPALEAAIKQLLEVPLSREQVPRIQFGIAPYLTATCAALFRRRACCQEEMAETGPTDRLIAGLCNENA